ncbi:rab effector MyRIP [Cottoperca gobio]|uniref:Rab effector MyRIP n=1 Tax=Cottoperca gobio TaxID=56716 RepID=A0A6J2RE55_COTGO|nr:rab effector MyRIP-like [Cottoperca gobio]
MLFPHYDSKLTKTLASEGRHPDLKQELDEEGSRCLLLSRQSCFNQRCCIRCCSPFTFLLNPKRPCRDCHFNVCKACRVYNKRDKAWLCSACQKSRLLKTQSLEWFYTNVKTRFKRFGSAKVLKTLYRKHLAGHSALSELTEGSAYEESICNEGSVCGSDSTFYRQTEEHSMAESLTVALRVAEETIDEAICKAEFDTASQEKQNEAHYLREHRGQLIKELSKTIVQKVISRRNTLAEIRSEYEQDWPLEHSTDLHHHYHHHHQSDCEQASSSLKHQPGLWRSHSAFSLLDNDPPGLIQDSSQALKKDAGGSTWRSVDRLDNTAVSSVLKSTDGNWIALQSAQLPRRSLLTRRKSLVFSALERESEVVSAYEGLCSDNETKPETDGSWGGVLQEFHRKLTDSNFNLQDSIPSPLTSSREDLFSDSEGEWKPKHLQALFKRKVPAEIRRPASSCRTNIIDVNFNVEGAGQKEQSKEVAEQEAGKVRRSRKKRRSKKELSSSVLDYSDEDNHYKLPSEAATANTLTSRATTLEPFDLESDVAGLGANQTEQELMSKQPAGRVSESSPAEEEEEADGAMDAGEDVQREENRRGNEEGDEEDERLWRMEIDLDEGRTEEDEEVDDEEMKCRFHRLIAHSRRTCFLSTDDDLDKVGRSEGEWEGDKDEDMEEADVERLNSKLCQLEKEVRANQFSSTEEELDRVGVMDEERKEEDEEDEELAVKVCRLVKQANATQFSSTEDELDRAGRDEEEEEAMGQEKLWKLQMEKDVQVSQLRDLASLVSASQFSSTEDELDRVGENEVEVEQEVNEAVGDNWERRDSFRDLYVNMFDLRDKIEEIKTDEVEDVQQEEKKDGNKRMVKGQICEEKVELFKEDKAKKAKEAGTRQDMELETVGQAERTEERRTKVQQANRPEAKWEEEEEESQDAAADSEEEDAEFERIISSMLTMTLEDMQVQTLEDEAAENGSADREPEEVETDENVNIGGESGFEDNAADAQSTNASEETGSAKEFQSRGDSVRVNVSEQIGEDISRKKQSGDAVGGNENEQQEKDAREKKNSAIEETLEAKRTCKRKVDDEEREDRGGKDTTEWKKMETHGDCESKERLEETKEESVDDTALSSTSSLHQSFLSPEEIQNGSDLEIYKTIQFMSSLLEQRYSAVSLRSITTEVLKVLNATEELLLQEVEGGDGPRLRNTSLPPDTNPKKLDQQFSRLEENVYVAAGEVYSLEAELSDLEECARGICSATPDMELSFLEEQVASAAAKVQQSELQVCDISARIAALKSAGLNVDTQQSRFTKTKTVPFMAVTVDSSRQQRRRLPAPPVKEDKEET